MTHPMRFSKKPATVEAMQWTGEAGAAAALIDWIESSGGVANLHIDSGVIAIETREGRMFASVGDWVIREPFPTNDRRFYPCKPEIFAATYEPANGYAA